MDNDLQHEDCRTTSMNNVTCRTLHDRFCNTDAKKPVTAADPWEINTSELHLLLSRETQYKYSNEPCPVNECQKTKNDKSWLPSSAGSHILK